MIERGGGRPDAFAEGRRPRLRREGRRGGAQPPADWNDAFGFASEGRAIRVSLSMGSDR
jgi:hypothetical protein